MKTENNSGRVHNPGVNREAIAKCLYSNLRKAREKVGDNSNTYVDITVGNAGYNSGRMRGGV